MRFIHMADVHLGAVPDSGCPWSAFREKEIWETFVRVIDQIREEKIELLLIAGDLFHRQPLPSQIEKVNQLFASLPDTEVVWMAGSHDYLRQDSAYRKIKWSANVHGFLSEKPQVISLERLNTRIYGCSYEQPEITEPLYRTIRPDEQPGIQILLAYGGDETHIPMRKEDGTGYDYVAMGYRHMAGVLVENQMAYAGSPEPIRLEDAGTHGVVYGEITETEPGKYETRITLVPCACRSYLTLPLRIHSGTTQAGLEQKVQDAVSQKGPDEIYWLRIQGYRNPELDFDLDALKAYGNIVKITDETRPCYDLSRLKREKLGTKVGAYIYHFEKKQGQTEQKALDYGLQALLAEHEDASQILAQKQQVWEEKKLDLENQREHRCAVLEQKVQRVMREHSGLEQQILVNGSEIRRLELNRNAEEKHLEQERREEGKRQAEKSRRAQILQTEKMEEDTAGVLQIQETQQLQAGEMTEEPIQEERSRTEQPKRQQLRKQQTQKLQREPEKGFGNPEQRYEELSVISRISTGITAAGVVLAILLWIDPFSWNRIACIVTGIVILAGALAGRLWVVSWIRKQEDAVEQNAIQQEKAALEKARIQKSPADWEIRLKKMKKELKIIEHQINQLREREVRLTTEREEKRIQAENLREEIREESRPGEEEEACDMEISGLKLALAVLQDIHVAEKD